MRRCVRLTIFKYLHVIKRCHDSPYHSLTRWNVERLLYAISFDNVNNENNGCILTVDHIISISFFYWKNNVVASKNATPILLIISIKIETIDYKDLYEKLYKNIWSVIWKKKNK